MRHGVILPATAYEPERHRSTVERVREYIVTRWRFLAVVVAPTLLVAGYYYLIAADQYQSEAHFIVRSGERGSSGSAGFGALLSMGGGAPQSASDVASVADYLRSHDVVETLKRRLDLVAIFRRPEADVFSQLHDANPTPETLLKYYRGKVEVHQDRDTGITELKVKTFAPADSYALARGLLTLGERRVNEMNARSYRDSVASAQRQLAEAEDAIAGVQSRVTRFRQAGADIDPQSSSQAQIKLVSDLNGKLAAARSQLSSMGGSISSSSPQYVALARTVRSLQAEIARQSGKLAGNASAMANSLGSYEDLRVRQEFVGKSYEAAAANLQKARDDARRQQLYIVRVVDANMPVKSLYPQRGKTVLTVFFALLLAYSIGWLIAAGVREHAA